MLLLALLAFNVILLALITTTMIYSAKTLKYGDTIGLYWPTSTNGKAGNVFFYLGVPMADFFHIIAQIVAYLTTPRGRKDIGVNRSYLHPVAALCGAIIFFGAWVYQLTFTWIFDYVGWENYRDGTWYGLAAARATFGLLTTLLWAVYLGWSAAAVHKHRRSKVRVMEERAREEGRRQGLEEGRREAETEGLELRGLETGGRMSKDVNGKVSGETMVDDNGGRRY
ncbi:hypothetical protein SLS57_005120 [Botryosphaeria dothidea]